MILSQTDTFLNLIIIVPTEVPLVTRTSPVTPLPALLGIAGSGVTGDVLVTNGTSVGTIVIKFRKVSGWDNIT